MSKDVEKNNLKQEIAEIKIGARGFEMANMNQLVAMLEVTLRSGLAPKGCNTLSDAIIRTQYGMSVGLDPMRALQSVYVVGGRPCLWGSAVPGLILSSGKCKSWKVELVGSGKDMLCRVTTERTDVAGENVFEFSMEDALLAGLPAKNPTWKQYPKDHLRHKAVARAATSIYGDLMSGLAVVEDMQDAIDIEAAVPADEAVASQLDAMAADLEAMAPEEEEPQQEAEVVTAAAPSSNDRDDITDLFPDTNYNDEG